MSTDLTIGDSGHKPFVLPTAAITDTFAVLANRGKGKSNAATVMAEQMHAAGLPVVVLDVKGDWWGIRSSADGKGPGLPFIIFGGDHPDVPLEPTAGALLADLIVDERISAVLDMSAMSKTKARSFTVDFAERLYRRNREPIHVIVEEADVLIPQRASADTARLLGAMEDLAKRGRSKGIGFTVVTQRPQEVAKSVLDLMETLILLGMTGPRSIAAIKEWISVNADDTTSAAEVVASLPSLPIGEAWIWSPAFLRVLTRVRIRRATTFDSHATPAPGQVRRQPRGRADIDLAALGERIAATVEKAKADDPRTLKARIVELERQAAVKPAPTVERVEVPVMSSELLARLTEIAGNTGRAIAEMNGALIGLTATLDAFVDDATRKAAPPPKTLPTVAPARSEPPQLLPDARRFPSHGGEVTLPKPQGRILDSLAWFASVGINPVDRGQLALYAGASSRSSAFGNNLGALRSAGLIEYPGRGQITLTDAGRALATEPADSITTSEDLHRALFARLPGPQVRILEALIGVYPADMDRTKLADVAGASPTSSAFGNNLGALRTLGLIDYPMRGRVVACDVLFLQAAS